MCKAGVLAQGLHRVVLASGCAGAVFPCVAACFWSHRVGLLSSGGAWASQLWLAGVFLSGWLCQVVGIGQQTEFISVPAEGLSSHTSAAAVTHPQAVLAGS